MVLFNLVLKVLCLITCMVILGPWFCNFYTTMKKSRLSLMLGLLAYVELDIVLSRQKEEISHDL